MADEAAAGLATARISFARVDAVTLARPYHEAVRMALKPGTAYSRYTRMWRMGQWYERDGLINGRIGFQTPSTTELFNEKAADFEEAAFTEGATSPFVIDPDSHRIAFQLRGRVIRPQTFAGALQALLNEASAFERWRVGPETRSVDWKTWVESVDHISQLRIRLDRPNPDYADRERVERLIEDTNARMIELVLTAGAEGRGIDVDDVFVVEALEHAEKYGRWSAEGVSGTEPPTRWRSDQEVATPERTIEADPKTHEARLDSMARELKANQPRSAAG